MSKVMVVEDDANLREIYSIRITAEGYEVVSAGDGEEALAIAVREKPDLILSDVMMPKISGFDMLDILRSTPETANIKVIMMTALSADDQKAFQDEYNKMIPGWYRFLIDSGLFGKAPKNVPTSFSYNGTKVCDYAFETETPQEEKDGWKVGVAYIVMKTAHINGSGETKEDIHKYAFEEYK